MTGGKGASAMQPAASGADGVKLTKGELDDVARMNEVAFLRQKRSNIPVDQVNLRFHPSRQCSMASRLF